MGEGAGEDIEVVVYTHNDLPLDEVDIATARLLGWGRLVGYATITLSMGLPAGSWLYTDEAKKGPVGRANWGGFMHCDGKKGDRVALWER